MAASICIDTFVLRITADASCDLALYAPGTPPSTASEIAMLRSASDPNADEREFAISPGNEQFKEYLFAYIIGSGFLATHPNFGFEATNLQDLLSGTTGINGSGNKSVMSIFPPILNPPSPDTTGGPKEVKFGTLRYNMACGAIVDNAEDQNLSGTLTLNTGV